MGVDFYIANRLRLSEPGSRRSAVSVRVSVAGVALSIAIMLLTIAIVRGFKQQITEKIIGFDSQISITAHDNTYENERPVSLTPELERVIRSEVPNAEINVSIAQPAMLKTDDNFSVVVFRGYGKGKNWDFIRECIVEGEMPDYGSVADSIRNSIVLSRTVARQLGLKVGDKIPTIFVIDSRMRIRNFRIAALYESHIGDYDKTVAFAPVETLATLRGFDADEGTRLEVSGLPFVEIQGAQEAVDQALARAYYTDITDDFLDSTSVLQTGAIYFNWLDLLDANVVVILILMSAIALFTLVASLFILILEKVNLIGTLKTIGTPDMLLRRVFIILTARILLKGLLIGNAVGLAIIAVQYYFRVLPLDPESYYISFVPVSITIWQILLLNLAAIVAVIMAMILPTMAIARMQPAKILRFD